MKIMVTVKQVPDTSGKVAVNPDGTLDRASMQTIINPDDLNAVEAALTLKDELGCKVVAFTMGPPPAEGMLRELMAMGVDEGVLVTAREFGGSDTYATSQIIAAAIDTYGIEKDDIILAGRQAIDGDTAQVGPQIAEKLDLPQVTYVEEFHIEDNLKDITVKRQLEDGYELIGIKTPCMLTAIKELNEPRYMNMKGIFGEKNIKIWNAKDIEVDLNKVGLEASPTNVFRSFTPAPKAPGQVVAGDTENEQAKNLLVQLKGKHII